MLVFVCDIQYKMSLSLLQDLVAEGYDVHACHSNPTMSPLGFAIRGLSARHSLPSVVTEEQSFLDALYELLAQCKSTLGEKAVLLAVASKTLELLAREEERSRFSKVCHFLAPTSEELATLHNKEAMGKIAKKAGVPVPKLYHKKSGSYPVVVKPHCGEHLGLKAAQRYAICQDKVAVKTAVDRFKELSSQTPLIQEYITGEGYGCSVLAVNGEVKQMISHRRLREYPITGGPSTACVTVSHKKLEDYSKALATATKLHGIAMFEYKGSEDTDFYFLEVNPRVWGTYPLTRLSGSSFSVDWVKASSGSKTLKAIPPVVGKKMQYFPQDALSALGYVRCGKLGKTVSAVGDLLNPFVADGVLTLSQPRSNVQYLLSLLGKRGR